MENNNWKDAKEVKKKVEAVKKKRTTNKTENKTESKQNKTQNTQPKKKTITKKQKEAKVKKFRKFIWKLILIEYLIFALFLSITNQIMLQRENEKKTRIIENQQLTIETLCQTYQNCLEPVVKGDAITIVHNTYKSPEKVFNISASDRELMAKLLYHEARGESIECQRAVVSVILNRVQSGKWGKTIPEVIYATNQFEPVAKGLLPNTKPLQAQYDAIDYVLETGTTLPSWVQYFRASYHFGWQNYTQYKSIDNTYFGGFQK